MALAIVGMVFTRRASKQHIAAKTRDGMLALGLLFLPLAVMIGRTLWLYSLDMFLLTVMTLIVFLVMRQLSAYLERDSLVYNGIGFLSLIPAGLLAPMLMISLNQAGFPVGALVMPMAFTTAAALIYDIAQRHPSFSAPSQWIAAIVLVYGLVFNQILHAGVITALISIAIGIGLQVFGYQQKQRSVFISGLVVTLSGIAQQLYELIHHFNLGNWLSFALLGMVTIVVASVLDARGRQLSRRVTQWKASFSEWD
jgi:hypothetical protein